MKWQYTSDQFRAQEEHLLDWYNRATSEEERKAAIITLNNLHETMQSGIRFGAEAEAKAKKPRRKLTAVEKFDKKNNRRQAILDQRSRRGTQE